MKQPGILTKIKELKTEHLNVHSYIERGKFDIIQSIDFTIVKFKDFSRGRIKTEMILHCNRNKSKSTENL